MGRSGVRYSEAFKRQVVRKLEQGEIASVYKAQKVYSIRGNETVSNWVRKYGREDLLPKRIRIETLKERDELKEARKRIRELEAALADAHIDCSLENSYLRIACERMDIDMDSFKKKNGITLSGIRKKQMGIK